MISLDTENENLNDFYDFPLFGGYFVLIFAVLPMPFLFLVDVFFDSAFAEAISKNGAFIVASWNFILAFRFGIKIAILFIPCWFLFAVIGLLQLFELI